MVSLTLYRFLDHSVDASCSASKTQSSSVFEVLSSSDSVELSWVCRCEQVFRFQRWTLVVSDWMNDEWWRMLLCRRPQAAAVGAVCDSIKRDRCWGRRGARSSVIISSWCHAEWSQHSSATQHARPFPYSISGYGYIYTSFLTMATCLQKIGGAASGSCPTGTADFRQGARNINVAPIFPQNEDFLFQNLAFLDENFSTRFFDNFSTAQNLRWAISFSMTRPRPFCHFHKFLPRDNFLLVRKFSSKNTKCGDVV